MSYLEYVVGAYAVFALCLAWDYLAPRLHLARIRRDIALRVQRRTLRTDNNGSHT